MGEYRLNAVRTDTDEEIDYIDLREPITADKLVRGREALEARVAVKYGESMVSGLVEITPGFRELPLPTALPELGIPDELTTCHLTVVED